MQVVGATPGGRTRRSGSGRCLHYKHGTRAIPAG
jgi:hypothetical protein